MDGRRRDARRRRRLTHHRIPGRICAVDADEHRAAAIDANNSTWELLDGRDYTPADVDVLLGRAYAAAYHWSQAAGRTPANDARASWLISRCHAVLGHGVLALHHADRCAEHVARAGLTDFDLGYAHEARARALACLGRRQEALTERALAGSIEIAEDEDREVFIGDLTAEPWFGVV